MITSTADGESPMSTVIFRTGLIFEKPNRHTFFLILFRTISKVWKHQNLKHHFLKKSNLNFFVRRESKYKRLIARTAADELRGSNRGLEACSPTSSAFSPVDRRTDQVRTGRRQKKESDSAYLAAATHQSAADRIPFTAIWIDTLAFEKKRIYMRTFMRRVKAHRSKPSKLL